MSNKSKENDITDKNHKTSKWFSTTIGATRYIMALAVFAIFIGSAALLISATFEMFGAVWNEIFGSGEDHGQLRVHLIESLDTILVSTVLYVIAVGLYQLFVNQSLKLPPWLQTYGVDDLEKRLAGMVITVLSVMFVTQVLQWHEGRDMLNLGLAIAAVIIAVSLFLYQENKFHHHKPVDNTEKQPLAHENEEE